MNENVNPTTRVNPQQVLKDVESYHALGTLSDYKANNPANSREAADAAYRALRDAEQRVVATQVAAANAADALVIARRDFHGVILGVKNEAKALYGLSSDEVAALGLKKKSERTKRSGGKKEGGV